MAFDSEGNLMSHTTKTIINRQWHIIDLLTKKECYLSTEDIRQYLNQKGIAAEIRTIQRDLNDLKEIFPLECRTDDKPYGWRWERVQGGSTQGLTLIQALAFRLIETQLQGYLPTQLMDELEPIFTKARFMLLDSQRLQPNEILLHDLINSLPKPKTKESPNHRNFYEPRPNRHTWLENDKKFKLNVFLDKPQAHQAHKHQEKLITHLTVELEKLDLQVLIKPINQPIK